MSGCIAAPHRRVAGGKLTVTAAPTYVPLYEDDSSLDVIAGVSANVEGRPYPDLLIFERMQARSMNGNRRPRRSTYPR